MTKALVLFWPLQFVETKERYATSQGAVYSITLTLWRCWPNIRNIVPSLKQPYLISTEYHYTKCCANVGPSYTTLVMQWSIYANVYIDITPMLRRCPSIEQHWADLSRFSRGLCLRLSPLFQVRENQYNFPRKSHLAMGTFWYML